MEDAAWTAADACVLGRRIKELREEQKLTQEDVAYAASLTRAHYALIESGSSSSRKHGTWARPKISTVAAIAAVLGVPMTDLFPFDRAPHPDATRTARAVLGHRPRNHTTPTE